MPVRDREGATQPSELGTRQLDALRRIAIVFSERRSDEVFAALHEVLADFGVRRLTIATLDRDPANPVRYHYHGDTEIPNPEPLDPQMLSLALGSDTPRFLAPTKPLTADLYRGRWRSTQDRLPTAMACPIRTAGTLLGFCVAQGNEPFSSPDLDLLSAAAVCTGKQLALGREESVNAAKSRALTLLLETARALSSELELDQLFATFHQLVGRVMDGSIFFAALLLPDGSAMEMPYWAEFGKSSTEKMKLPLTTVSGDVLRSGQPVIIRQPKDWERVTAITFGEATDPASALIVPMKLGSRVLGVLSVQSPRAGAYSESDCELLVAISEQAAVAVENLRNLKASTQRAADLNLLVEVASAVSSELDLQAVFSKVHKQVRRVIDAPLFYVALSGDSAGSVRLEYLVEGEHVFEATKYRTEGTIVGLVLASGKPVHVRNAEERDRLTRQRIGHGETTVQSVIAVPMKVGGKVIGAISAQSYQPNAYDERHLKLLSAIAEQSAVAVQNAQLYEQTKLLADTDALTGLPHHRTIQERLALEVKRAQRSGGKLALLMMDVDDFKNFNDTYGHPVGDEVLRHIGRMLRELARETDVVGRYGGDEFCAILPDTDRAAADKFVARLTAQASRRPLPVSDTESLPMGLSVGIAVFPDDCDSAQALVAAADSAMYARKRERDKLR